MFHNSNTEVFYYIQAINQVHTDIGFCYDWFTSLMTLLFLQLTESLQLHQVVFTRFYTRTINNIIPCGSKFRSVVDIIFQVVWRNRSSVFSSNSEVNVSEILECLKDIFPHY